MPKMRMRGKPLGVEHRTGVINTNPILDDVLPDERERWLVLMFKSFSIRASATRNEAVKPEIICQSPPSSRLRKEDCYRAGLK